MNLLEEKITDLLKELKENYNAIALKAEFEDEGSSLEDTLRLQGFANRAGLELNVKIGGCGALKDLYEAKHFGAKSIVAPMIESAYAVEKYLQTIDIAFEEDEKEQTDFYINLETIVGYKNIDQILSVSNHKNIKGIVVGRLDFVKSMNLANKKVNSCQIFEITSDIAQRVKQLQKKLTIGGNVSTESVDFFKNLPNNSLDHIETRKVVFDFKRSSNSKETLEEGIKKALNFEILWIENKQQNYGIFQKEDTLRLKVLKERYEKEIQKIGTYSYTE